MSLLKVLEGSKPQPSKPSMVAVYRRGDTVYMHPQVKTTDGVFIFAEPVVQLDKDDTQVPVHLIELLSVRRTIVAHPTSWRGLTDPLLKAAKVRSFNAFAASTKLVEIERDDDGISLLPTRNGGPKEGFVHLNEKRRHSRPVVEDVRAGLEAAFADCE